MQPTTLPPAATRGMLYFSMMKIESCFFVCLGEVVVHFGWMCHAYCMMDNHYHLLIETPEGNLSLSMRQLNGAYTQRFNRRHAEHAAVERRLYPAFQPSSRGRMGHLFQGRFKAIVVDRDSYLLELCRYVVQTRYAPSW